MKKIFLFLCIVLSLGVVTNSCIYNVVDEMVKKPDPNPDPNPDPDPDPNPDPDPVVTDKTFSFQGRVSISERINTYAIVDMGSNDVKVNWSSPDLNFGLSLKGETGNSFLFENREVSFFSNGNTISTNSVTVSTSETNGILYGYYPYQSSATGTFTLSNKQDQSVVDSVMDKSLNRNMLMIADPTASFPLSGGTSHIYFKNVFSILRFRVNKDIISPVSEAINKIQIYIAKKNKPEIPLNYPLAGSYTIDVNTAPGANGYRGPVFSSPSNVITADITNSDRISQESYRPSVWLIMNPVTMQSDECLVSIVETNNYKIISSHTMSSFSANTVYDIRVIASESNTVTDYISTYFLKNEAANSYIISRAGICQIPLNMINGTDLRGRTVEWLWASKEGGNADFDINELIDPSTIFYNEAEEYVRFRVGTPFGKFTKGNVILALKNDLNEIVWTWHIWITDKPQDLEYEGGSVFLDRNIGALTTRMSSHGIDNYGFVYQWGRKDPFFGGDGRSNENPTVSSILSIAKNNTMRSGNINWSVSNTSASTPLNAVRNPMQFFSSAALSSQPADWLSVSDTTLWYDTKKGNYDPCPSGYRVPGVNELISLHIAPSDGPFGYFKLINNKYWEYFYYSTGATSVWPAAGMRYGRSNSNRGAQLVSSGTDSDKGESYYWTSTPRTVDGVKQTGESHRIQTSVSNILYSKDTSGDNADAYPIRCIKIQ